MKIKTVWQERAKFTTKSKNSTNENTSQSDDTTPDMSSLSNTFRTLENIRKKLKETQSTWQEEIKEMINNTSKGKVQEEILRKDEQDKHNENNTNVKEIIEK